MELFRSLGALAEPPSLEAERLAQILDLGPPPEPAEFTDLFESKLYPYASVYLDDSGKLGGNARDTIAGFWRALDLEYPEESDHLAIMLSFYARMRELAGDSREPDANRWEHARVAFLHEHLLSWLPFYLDKLTDVASGFYNRWGALLAQALVHEREGLKHDTTLSLHLRDSTPMADPRTKGGEAFVESLLAPVRSGLILVRTDLERAGGELDLGVRIGERRYVIEALFSQDAVSTLDWLAQEADLWGQRHLKREKRTGPTARFWADRALGSRDLLHELAEQARHT